ncbi:hypothetical protein HAX54_004767, partial [Datura stramonium]|nr:hypothetical protein [Datura stramonium]
MDSLSEGMKMHEIRAAKSRQHAMPRIPHTQLHVTLGEVPVQHHVTQEGSMPCHENYCARRLPDNTP